MAKTDTAKALALLQTAFSQHMDDKKMKLYVEMLADINPMTLAVAVKNAINTCDYLPSVATLRRLAGNVSAYVNDKEQEGISDAWGVVLKAVRLGGYERGLEYLDGIVLETAKPMWRDICYDENIMASRAHFMKAYEQNVKRANERTLIREAVANVPLMQEARERSVIANTNKGKKRIAMLCNGLLKEIPDEKEAPKV